MVDVARFPVMTAMSLMSRCRQAKGRVNRVRMGNSATFLIVIESCRDLSLANCRPDAHSSPIFRAHRYNQQSLPALSDSQLSPCSLFLGEVLRITTFEGAC